MKRVYITLFILLLTGQVFSQDFTGISICINPGHGGHDGDDRFIEETGFWESEGNLTKGLYLRDILENCGATIVMSRVTNFTSDDLPLSQISQIANDNNVDFFQSIHSNGFDGVSNYPLMLFRGYDNDPVFPEAKAMGEVMWHELWDNGNGWTTSETVRNRGDWDFYPWGTQGLGVLRELTMPGVLSEGSFHDYVPESWRLQNLDYRKHEAWVFARSFVDYYNTDIFNTGIVAGIVRDSFASPEYYADSNTLDVDAPINGATVTLSPGDIVYELDDMNNGYFFFDSITPGDYVLTYNAAGFFTKVENISVVENQTTFINEYLLIDTLIAPQVLYHDPVSTIDDSVAINQVFTVHFDYPMNQDSVENAISISPNENLEFSWDEGSRIISISPETLYIDDTHYTITISTLAKHLWNLPISEPYILDFYTIERTSLVLDDMYPKNDMNEVSNILQFRLYFDAPLDETTINDNVILYNSSNEEVPITAEIILEEDGKGLYFFESENELNLNSDYKLAISESLADIYGITFGENIEINFTTMTDPYELGTVFDDFEDISSWWDPDGSGSTTGTLDEFTTFTQSNDYVINGNYTGRLDYAFENNIGGVVRAHNSATPSIGSDPDSKVGFWVFGDLSYNILEYWFYPSDVSYSPVYVDTIDWAGWELKYIPYSDIGTGPTRFASLVVIQTDEGAMNGTMYFDDGQLVSSVGIDENLKHESFMMQNYPNPFNSTTTFNYNIDSDSHVKLSIYDILGKQVNVLINEKKAKGNHNYVWNVTDNNLKLSPGLYIYKFETVSSDNNVHIETATCILTQ